jgi:3-oxoacyl-[acyl-carrier-protein] synthase-3
MTHAAIVGWGKCLPPATLHNAELSTFLDTNDEWIFSRTGMRERRISHVPLGELAHVAAARALACAGVRADAVDLIIVGSTLGDELAPNVASGVQRRLGAVNAACMDLNTACTSFLYGLSTATALVRTGSVRTALVIGAEVPTPFVDWDDRNTAVLFGDGAGAVVVQASAREEGLLAERMGCYGDARGILDIRGVGARYANLGLPYGHTVWHFDGQEIFRRAVVGMSDASREALAKCGMTVDDVDLMIPHQANRRIIDAVGRRVGIASEKVFVNIERYGNMSAATIPVALVEAVEAGRVAPGARLLLPAFGAGLAWCAHVVRWGERTAGRGAIELDLPPCAQTGLELVMQLRARRAKHLAAARPFIEEARPIMTGPAR